MRTSTILASILVLPSLAACIVNPGPSHREPEPTPAISSSPMVVEVETNQTMVAKGGEGVGVFVQYRAGGHWHVWLTCDTLVSGLDCRFKVSAVASSGALSNLLQTPGKTAPIDLSTIGGAITASAQLTNEVAGIDFDSDAGATLTVTATVSGVQSGDFFFFVQDGKVNGGFGGRLTNPLRFEPTKP